MRPSESLGRTLKAMDLEELALASGAATVSLLAATTRRALLIRLAELRGKPAMTASEDTWRLTVKMLADRRRECLRCVVAGRTEPAGHRCPGTPADPPAFTR